MTSKSRKPLPLSEILRDLALLRASAHDIPEIFKAAQQDSDVTCSPESTPSVAASYNYVATVRAAIKLNDSGKLGAEGKKIEDVRNKYEELDSILALSMLLPSPTLVVRVLSPSFVFFVALSIAFLRPLSPDSPSPITSVVVATAEPRRALILSFLSLTALTYLFDGLAFVIFAIIEHRWPHHTGIPFSAVIGLVAFSGLAALGTWKDIHGIEIWSLRRIKVAIIATLCFDISLAVLLGLSLYHRDDAPPHIPEAPIYSISTLIHAIAPAFRVLLLLPLLAGLRSPFITYGPTTSNNDIEQPTPTDSSFLLPPPSGAQPSTGLSAVSGPAEENSKYGTFRTAHTDMQPSASATRVATPVPSTSADLKPDDNISFEPTWSEVLTRIRRLFPYLWPKSSTYLQFLAAICIVILLLGRAINLAMPLALGELVSILEGQSSQSPWPFLFGYIALKFLQGNGGLSALRNSLWAPVMQYSDREMSQLSFDHLLNLSFAWHTRRKTGEILRVLDRGAAINRTFELILFSVIPIFIDIVVALITFCVIFRWTLALVIFLTMAAYVSASIILTKWRTRLRRKMNERDIVTRGIHTDCLLNYETVKYFGGEQYEGERYREAIREYQELEYKVTISANILNLVQNFIITLGLLTGSLMVAYEVTSGGKHEASKFVVFITYISQLYSPLNQLGFLYHSINQSLVDTEKLLALLNEATEVNDKPNAPDLIVHDGEIVFENVHFSYDHRMSALNGVSFKVPKGSSVALVGESGSGKSTILRLLYRFYDLGEGQGRILIDGQDIRDITQTSLRKAIGVVPQESVLFNTSIGYNIGYGKFGSTSDEIESAAQSAHMHERIMSFPDGYQTKVGERGVRLSSGEKQRVAIARTLLKNPPILLLDEATSALDTSTEKDIQKALQNLVEGRSSLSIAHRLSTIASADVILVLKDGQIAEQGNFKELLAIDGIFASMWADQVSATDDPVLSVSGTGVKREVSGYIVDQEETKQEEAKREETKQEETTQDMPQQDKQDNPQQDKPQDIAETFDQIAFPAALTAESADVPVEEEQVKIDVPLAVATVGEGPLPQSEPVDNIDTPDTAPIIPVPVNLQPSVATVEFPTTLKTPQPEMRRSDSPISFTPAVTFGVNSPPSRTGTPGPEDEGKRKRISSQNFQRLARRISLSTRRQGSVSSLIPSIPGLKRSESPRVSTDDDTRAEGSTTDSASSVKGGKSKKVKKATT